MTDIAKIAAGMSRTFVSVWLKPRRAQDGGMHISRTADYKAIKKWAFAHGLAAKWGRYTQTGLALREYLENQHD